MENYKTINQNKVDMEIGYKVPKQDEIMERFIANAKQEETLEDAAKEFFRKFKHTHSPDNYYLALVEFAKWQQEQDAKEIKLLREELAYEKRNKTRKL